MAYKVIKDFKDLMDNGYEYKSGDVYPHSGEADPKRAVHLMTPTPQRGALIEEVKEPVTKPATTERKKTERKKKED